MTTLEETTAPTAFVSSDARVATGLPARLKTTRDDLIIATGRVVVVLIPVLAIFLIFHRTTFGLVDAGGLAAIWFLALRITFGAAWLPALALGACTAAALGT